MCEVGKLQFAVGTHVGLVRKNNQDAFILAPDLNLFGVADGMGGHAAGEIASQMAGEIIIQELARNREQLIGPGILGLLRQAVEKANQEIYHRGRLENQNLGMGTTVTCGYFSGDSNLLVIAHVGDSRAYRWRRGELKLLTHDHSLVYQLYQNGGISLEEAFKHPQRNILTRALGMDPAVVVDLTELTIEPDDLYLFCTDGLSGQVRDEEMLELLQTWQEDNSDLPTLANRLIEEALERGGKDNITLVLVKPR
ncbi:protein phosphatase [Carboxydocella sporoproducens DSM 16521]|uniref:Protein phosphatase n=2 Tax=Carboxydocella TaxID=178898 RepID=A0A1T4MV95_9FIRM|nr:protein phosphatase [Carboxydocella thermautotrophica]AVX30747.1 protein phosphatase [Carboxydocella thermautotrophica]GAW30106.1 hypothetical protein ULO1_26760 [Carboxydocella sp. ULO1]SJZ70568.1 protein phosphatase [Carboxydocella sporoproducens DSM 16521]